MSFEGGASDQYRVLFDQLHIGAARFRGREIVASNAAFEPFRALVPDLCAMITAAHDSARPHKQELRVDGKVLAISALPTGDGDVIVVIDDLTREEDLERRIRDSQGRFEQAFQGNGAAMVIAHQRDLRIIDVNQRWVEMFGTTREEVIGRTSVELGLISADDARTRIAQHSKFVEGYDIELALRTRAGAPLTVLASAKPIEIAEGPCTLTTLIDISGRKHAEEAFAVAFSASPAGMILVDSETDTVVAVNRRMIELIRMPREALVGHNAADESVIRRPARAELMAEVARSGRLDAVEVELACPFGPEVWALASTESITLDDKPHRLTVFTDITARKRRERSLLTQYAVGRMLAESSDLATTIPSVLERLCRGESWRAGAVWLSDDEGALRCRGLWHDLVAADHLEQVTRQTVLARDAGLLGRVFASGQAEQTDLDPARGAHGAAAFGAGMRRAVAFPILLGNTVLGVVAMASADDPAPLDAGELGLFDAVGRLLGSFVERTLAEAALRELNANLERRVHERTLELESTNRDLEAFTSSVSHDLRAPLRAIAGFSQILLDDYGPTLPAEAQRLLGRIRAGGNRLRDLIDDLLGFARLGRSPVHRVDVDLDALVPGVVDDVLAARDVGDKLELKLGPLGWCSADPSLLRQVWYNLLDNALKYARTRDRIEIEVGADRQGDDIVYFVRDNGVGFDMTYADRLFGMFQRLHASTEFEGTGVGLANVRRIVERHHGHVSATSVLGRGSTFEFTLGAAPP